MAKYQKVPQESSNYNVNHMKKAHFVVAVDWQTKGIQQKRIHLFYIYSNKMNVNQWKQANC